MGKSAQKWTWAPAGFFQGRASGESKLQGSRRGVVLGERLRPPPRQLVCLWESAISSPIGVQGETLVQIDLYTIFNLLMTIGAYEFCSWSPMYNHKIWGHIGFSILNKMITCIGRSRRGRANWLPRLILNAITLYNFSRGGEGKCTAPLPKPGAPMNVAHMSDIGIESNLLTTCWGRSY